MTQSQIAMSQSLTDSMIQDMNEHKENKELSKLQSFVANEKHENEKENSVNNGASGPPAEQSTESTNTPTTRIDSDLLIEDSIGHTNGHGNGTLEDKL